MKKTLLLGILVMPLLLSGCTYNNGLTSNLNNHATEVVLSRNNFRVVEAVRGSSRATYVFGLGGMSKRAMVAQARAKMLAKAQLVGSSRAVINETLEVSYTFFPIVRQYQVTVSAHIVEFTE